MPSTRHSVSSSDHYTPATVKLETRTNINAKFNPSCYLTPRLGSGSLSHTVPSAPEFTWSETHTTVQQRSLSWATYGLEYRLYPETNAPFSASSVSGFLLSYKDQMSQNPTSTCEDWIWAWLLVVYDPWQTDGRHMSLLLWPHLRPLALRYTTHL